MQDILIKVAFNNKLPERVLAMDVLLSHEKEHEKDISMKEISIIYNLLAFSFEAIPKNVLNINCYSNSSKL